MFVAKSGPTGWLLHASQAIPVLGPFYCPVTGERVDLKQGTKVIAHFARRNIGYEESESEGERHKRIVNEIVVGLESAGLVVEKEKRLKGIRCDIYTVINGAPIGIEIQHSSLSVSKLIERTRRYTKNNVSVLWISIKSHSNKSYREPVIWERELQKFYPDCLLEWVSGCIVNPYRYHTVYRPIGAKNFVKGNFKPIPYEKIRYVQTMKANITLSLLKPSTVMYNGEELMVAVPIAPVNWPKIPQKCVIGIFGVNKH